MANWLVTGGAGYIGAHVVDALHTQGEQAVVLDDLSTGARERAAEAVFVEGTILDEDLVRRALREHQVQGIIHIAAKKQVGESVEKPLFYYEQNVVGTLRLLSAAVAEGVSSFVFSSSAATYGMPDADIVTEDMAGKPLSPYGTTKLICEFASRETAAATGLRVMSLRYFNVAGAARPELGDPGVFNLIPLVFQALEAGEPPRIFGADYPTPDGTCIRDYVHVADIADAHVAALRALSTGGGEASYSEYNVGRGEGTSVREVIDLVAEVTGREIEPKVVDRRPGDPARIVGSVEAIKRDLGWTARYDLREMVESAWQAWQHHRT